MDREGCDCQGQVEGVLFSETYQEDEFCRFGLGR